MRSLVRLLPVLAVALPLFAQLEGIRVYPTAPTTDTPVTIGVITSCFLDAAYSVEVSERTITVVVAPRGTCPSPPIPVLKRIDIGKLPSGSYRLRYRFVGVGEIVDTGRNIHVRHATNPARFEIHPFAVRTNPAGLQMRVSSAETICQAADCSDIIIRVGGTRVSTPIRRENANTIWFDAPPHPVGLQNVVIEKSNPVSTWTASDAVLYFDGPDLGAFERILFPTLFNARGANGSEWLAEGAISNPNPYYVENYNSLLTIVCITYPCGERLSPNSYVRLLGGPWPQGVMLLAPRVEAPSLEFALRVRDVSRQAESFGTEVPVVRESDMIMDKPIRLLDVPLDPNYRVKLRVYAYDPVPIDDPVVVVTNADTNQVKASYRLTLKNSCESCPDTPEYAELDLPLGTTLERVTLSITMPPGTPSWAFATVTNNTTQQVTVVTPQ